jgi:predicted  nucleic acid-binding Zn-ribbon protein
MAIEVTEFELEELVQEQERIARLEEKVEHIQDDLGELKTDVRAVKDSLYALGIELKESLAAIDRRFSKLDTSRALDKVWWLTIAAGILTVMARGFKWV